MDRQRIGMIGTGRMGTAMAKRLCELGHEVAVWNRTAAKTVGAVEGGATAVESLAALCDRADVLISSLTDYGALQAVHEGAHGLLAQDISGKLYIEMSTLLPTEQQALETGVTAAGCGYVECPVGGTVGPALKGMLLGLASHWDTVYPEAATHPLNPVIRGSQSTLVVAGGGTVTELVGVVPSTIILVDHALVRTFYKGAIGLVVVGGDADEEVFAAGVSDAGNAPAEPSPTAQPTSTPSDSRPPPTPSSEAVETDEVTITPGAWDPANADVAYSPREIRVTPGTTVTWTNDDLVLHTVTSGRSDGRRGTPDRLFDSGDMLEGDSFSFTFDEAGTYDYYCSPHPWMTGTVIVEEA